MGVSEKQTSPRSALTSTARRQSFEGRCGQQLTGLGWGCLLEGDKPACYYLTGADRRPRTPGPEPKDFIPHGHRRHGHGRHPPASLPPPPPPEPHSSEAEKPTGAVGTGSLSQLRPLSVRDPPLLRWAVSKPALSQGHHLQNRLRRGPGGG